MATSSLLGIDADHLPPAHSATGIDSLGPSDASDSGSDSAGAYSSETDSDTDRFGTGERSSVEPAPQPLARDILPDHVEDMSEESEEPGMDMEDNGLPEAPDMQHGTHGHAAPLTADDLPESEATDEDEESD